MSKKSPEKQEWDNIVRLAKLAVLEAHNAEVIAEVNCRLSQAGLPATYPSRFGRPRLTPAERAERERAERERAERERARHLQRIVGLAKYRGLTAEEILDAFTGGS